MKCLRQKSSYASDVCDHGARAGTCWDDRDASVNDWRMRSEVCRPDVFVYTELVKTMVRRGYMDGCIRVWKEMEKDGVEPDAMAYATMVGGLCKAGMVEEAAELFKEMRSKCLLVDRMVYASLIDGYVSIGRVGDGCRVLDEMIDAGYRADLEI